MVPLLPLLLGVPLLPLLLGVPLVPLLPLDDGVPDELPPVGVVGDVSPCFTPPSSEPPQAITPAASATQDTHATEATITRVRFFTASPPPCHTR
jgi:hypothetical protein